MEAPSVMGHSYIHSNGDTVDNNYQNSLQSDGYLTKINPIFDLRGTRNEEMAFIAPSLTVTSHTYRAVYPIIISRIVGLFIAVQKRTRNSRKRKSAGGIAETTNSEHP